MINLLNSRLKIDKNLNHSLQLIDVQEDKSVTFLKASSLSILDYGVKLYPFQNREAKEIIFT